MYDMTIFSRVPPKLQPKITEKTNFLEKVSRRLRNSDRDIFAEVDFGEEEVEEGRADM